MVEKGQVRRRKIERGTCSRSSGDSTPTGQLQIRTDTAKSTGTTRSSPLSDHLDRALLLHLKISVGTCKDRTPVERRMKTVVAYDITGERVSRYWPIVSGWLEKDSGGPCTLTQPGARAVCDHVARQSRLIHEVLSVHMH